MKVNTVNKQEKILITGGAGFIGANVACMAVNNGHEVVILDNLSTQIHGDGAAIPKKLLELQGRGIRFIRGDVRNRSDWESALQDVSVVIHLAAETGTGQSMYEIEKYCDVNIGGLTIFLDLVANKKTQVKKIVIASSRSLYGEGKYKDSQGHIFYPGSRSVENMAAGLFECMSPIDNTPLIMLPTDEDSRIHPVSIYGITKSTQEQLVIETAKACGISAISLRYQNVYGPGQSLHNPYTGILSIFSNQMLLGNDINIFEDGKESRDFVYIDDVVDATLMAATEGSGITGIFNVGSGVATDVLSIATTLKEIYSSVSKLAITGNFRIGDIRHNLADLTRIQTVFGFTPSVKFGEGVQKFAQWVLGEGPKNSLYEKSLAEMKSKGLLK